MKILTYIIMTISVFYNSFNRVFPVIAKVIKFLLLDTMEKSQIFTFFHIFCEILSDGFLKSTSSLFCVNTHQIIFLKIILKSMIFFYSTIPRNLAYSPQVTCITSCIYSGKVHTTHSFSYMIHNRI